MRTPKISPTIPDKIVVGGKTLVRKSLYKGKILEKTPELEAEIEKIDKEIGNLLAEIYNLQKVKTMFVTSKEAQNRLTNRVNYIGTDIDALMAKKKKLMQEHLAKQD
ncbi:hypothetical protein IKQ21_09825 [bacterium]|nr:hypothetical protein [bacterium]